MRNCNYSPALQVFDEDNVHDRDYSDDQDDDGEGAEGVGLEKHQSKRNRRTLAVGLYTPSVDLCDVELRLCRS